MPAKKIATEETRPGVGGWAQLNARVTGDAKDRAARIAARGTTANQEAFAAWLIEVTGAKFKTATERAAFVSAACLAPQLYKTYQSSKPTSARYNAESAEVVEVVASRRTSKAKPAPTTSATPRRTRKASER